MTWIDLQLESLNCPVLHQAVTLANGGELTREQALIEAAIWLSRDRQKRLNQDAQQLMREPARPIVIDRDIFDRAHGLHSPCSCEVDKHDFNCPVHNDYGPSRRGPNGDEE